MTSLTNAAKYSRNAVRYGSIGFVVLIILIIIVLTVKSYLDGRRPVVVALPTVLYGKLPAITFPPERSRPGKFILQTIQGDVPEATSSARVYQIPKKTANLLSGKTAQQLAGRLNFLVDPVEKRVDLYAFADVDYPARKLEVDPITGNFKLKYNLQIDPTPQNGNFLNTDNNSAIDEARVFFGSIGKFNEDLRQGRKVVSYHVFNGEDYEEINNKFQAAFVRVDMFKPNIGDYELKTPIINKSSVYIIFSGRQEEKQRIVEVGYDYNPAINFSDATYPLKRGKEAWEELSSGGGYVVNQGESNTSEAIVRDAFLAYYDLGEYQKYLQPIYVFVGDNGFEAYVSAVKSEWIE